jgi:hypothetical protein
MASSYQSWSRAKVLPGLGRTAARGVFITALTSCSTGLVSTSMDTGEPLGISTPRGATTAGVAAPHATSTASASYVSARRRLDAHRPAAVEHH